MTDYKMVPMPPTREMVEAAADAYMPLGDMDLAIRMAVLAAPDVQGEPVAGGPLHPSQVQALRRNVKRNCPPEIYALLDQAIAAHQPGVTQLVEALELALEYWRHRQQRYKNRRPKWVITAEDALAELERRNQQTGGGA